MRRDSAHLLALCALLLGCPSTPTPSDVPPSDSALDAQAVFDVRSSEGVAPQTDSPVSVDAGLTAFERCVGSWDQVPDRCPRCVRTSCEAAYDAAFGPAGVCRELIACIETSGSCDLLRCAAAWTSGPCAAAMRALSSCHQTCVTECARAVCGDGVITSPDEDCDGAMLQPGAHCVDLGFTGGTLRCGSDCRYDTAACVPARCGDGLINRDEACDGALFRNPSESCTNQGFLRGTIGCTADCHLDTSACNGCDTATCGGCCQGDRCHLDESSAFCGTHGMACAACGSGQACRFTNPEWACVALLGDGQPCDLAHAYRCQGEVCSEGRCATGCVPTVAASCWGDRPCCRSTATCSRGSRPMGSPGVCCLPSGTHVATAAECMYCCSDSGPGYCNSADPLVCHE